MASTSKKKAKVQETKSRLWDKSFEKKKSGSEEEYEIKLNDSPLLPHHMKQRKNEQTTVHSTPQASSSPGK